MIGAGKEALSRLTTYGKVKGRYGQGPMDKDLWTRFFSFGGVFEALFNLRCVCLLTPPSGFVISYRYNFWEIPVMRTIKSRSYMFVCPPPR